jgi:hypothetical protein
VKPGVQIPVPPKTKKNPDIEGYILDDSICMRLQKQANPWAGSVAQVIEHLPSKHKTLSSNPSDARG